MRLFSNFFFFFGHLFSGVSYTKTEKQAEVWGLKRCRTELSGVSARVQWLTRCPLGSPATHQGLSKFCFQFAADVKIAISALEVKRAAVMLVRYRACEVPSEAPRDLDATECDGWRLNLKVHCDVTNLENLCCVPKSRPGLRRVCFSRQPNGFWQRKNCNTHLNQQPN